MDYGRNDPIIDTAYFPNTVAAGFWSSTTHSYLTDHAWIMFFNWGYGFCNYSKSNPCYVRAVRGGQ